MIPGFSWVRRGNTVGTELVYGEVTDRSFAFKALNGLSVGNWRKLKVASPVV